jgi:single-strand DNA-binding protein
MKTFGLARIGRDVEVRHTQQGEAVASLALAFNYRNKGEKATQWIEASLWGKRAEALAPYLAKGGLISVTIDDVHIETYEGRNGHGTKLVGRVSDIELAGGGQQAEQPQKPAPVRQAPKPAPASSGFDDMDSDIPFITCSMSYDMTTSKQRKIARYDY